LVLEEVPEGVRRCPRSDCLVVQEALLSSDAVFARLLSLHFFVSECGFDVYPLSGDGEWLGDQWEPSGVWPTRWPYTALWLNRTRDQPLAHTTSP
jgi:hypothetical protein